MTIAGLMVGNELSVAIVHARLWALPNKVHIPVVTSLARLYGRIMPYWYAAILLLTVAVVFILPWDVGSWFAIGAAAVWVVTIVLAAVVLAPINHRVAEWDVDSLPNDWQVQRQRWDRLHMLRLALLIEGWICVIVGVLI